MLKKLVRSLWFTVLMIISSFFAAPAFAVGLTPEECFKDTIAKLGCLPYYLGNIINGFFALSAIATVVLIIISGIRFLSSGGDEATVYKARRSLTYSIIGFIIVLSSFFILKVVSFMTGAECINALGFNTCS